MAIGALLWEGREASMWTRSGTSDLIFRRTSPDEERTLMSGRRRERLDEASLMGPRTLAIESAAECGML